ncbi:MAG: hypothetical protein ACI9KE_002516 [Polyangiales bacterium]|jgi:hypothetical protein
MGRMARDFYEASPYLALPIAALAIFLLAFLMVSLLTLSMRKGDAEDRARLALSDGQILSNGERREERTDA